jgi:antitoxin component of MazEF toxin-antitoxin module
MKQRVIRIGNSAGVTVPADFVKSVGVKIGDSVEVEKRIERGEVIYKFSGCQQLLIATNFLKRKAKQTK